MFVKFVKLINATFIIAARAAKIIWKKLRNNHRDALRRQRAAVESGATPGSIKKWRYQKQMEFLLQYMNVRPYDAILEEDRDVDKSQPELEFVDEYTMLENLVSEDGEDEDVDIISHSDIPELYAETPSCTLYAETPPCTSDSNSVNLTVKNSNKKIKKQDGSASIKKQNEQKVKKNKPPENESSNDELYYFYLSMYKITKKMPPASQHIVRKKVFEVISQAEAELLDLVEIPQRSYPYSNTSYIMNDNQNNGPMKFLPGT